MNECSSEDLSLIYVPKKYCRSDLKLLQSYVVLESKGDALAVVPNTSVSHPSEDITPHIIIVFGPFVIGYSWGRSRRVTESKSRLLSWDAIIHWARSWNRGRIKGLLCGRNKWPKNHENCNGIMEIIWVAVAHRTKKSCLLWELFKCILYHHISLGINL